MSGKTQTQHFTVRPGFAIAVGLLVISLYFVWAAFGAAPISLSFANSSGEPDELPMPMESVEIESATMKGMAMGGEAGGMTPDEFTDIAYNFIDDLSLEDGSVRPTMEWTMKSQSDGGEMDASTAMQPGGDMDADTPIDVYVIVQRFGYEPSVLRLKKDTPYRFIMMAIDVNHGAAIRTALAGHIMRRPAMVLTETVMTFTETGEFMMYCTVYCGVGHDQMRGKIIVE
ncbi:MAG: hypothetical protein GXP03_07285 [Alphaproteobacteria bacterium]|nr:hypothetical protein [Alphaproteobacteria bacterium]